MRRSSLRLFSLEIPAAAWGVVFAGLLLAGCQKQGSEQTNFQPGEAILAGPLTYNVVQSTWRTELGDILKRRTPERRYLLITVSATNKGRQSVSLPFFALEGDAHEEYPELQDGSGVNNWFGLLRELGPGETRQGVLLFDVPLKPFRLRLTDGGEPGTEKFVWVEIPLNLETDTDSHVTLPSVSGR